MKKVVDPDASKRCDPSNNDTQRQDVDHGIACGSYQLPATSYHAHSQTANRKRFSLKKNSYNILFIFVLTILYEKCIFLLIYIYTLILVRSLTDRTGRRDLIPTTYHIKIACSLPLESHTGTNNYNNNQPTVSKNQECHHSPC